MEKPSSGCQAVTALGCHSFQPLSFDIRGARAFFRCPVSLGPGLLQFSSQLDVLNILSGLDGALLAEALWE